jgi:hypothetical protein
MTNLVVTTTTNAVKVSFNDTPFGSVTKGVWRKDKMTSFYLEATHIHVNTVEGTFYVSNAAETGTFIIDSVDGVAPSSLSDLFDKLSAMLG